MPNATLHMLVSACGFGLMLALNSFTLWGTADLLDPSFTWPWAASELSSFCLPANVLAFLLYGLAALAVPSLSRRRPTLPACIALAVGAILLLVACAQEAHVPELFRLAGLFLGIGGALAFICWEFSFAGLGIARARKAILLASLLSAVPYLALVFLARDAMVWPLTLVLVPACIVLLVLAQVLLPGPVGAETVHPDTAHWAATWRDLWLPLVCTMMIGVIGPAAGVFATFGDMASALRVLLYQIANVVAVVVLAVCWFGLRRSPSLASAFLALVPPLVVALFLFPFCPQGYHGFVAGLGCFVFSLVSILMMMTCLEASERYRVGLGTVYGLFAAGTYLAQVLGRSLADVVAASTYPRQIQVVAVVALLLWGLSAVAIITMWRARPGRRGQVGLAGGIGEAGEGAQQGIAGQAANSASSATPSASSIGSSDAAAAHPDDLAARCAALGARFGLTPREVEVLELIGHGRDVGAIAEILGVSRNTVRTHVQRLYGDLDVHTRQEIIDLLESARPQG